MSEESAGQGPEKTPPKVISIVVAGFESAQSDDVCLRLRDLPDVRVVGVAAGSLEAAAVVCELEPDFVLLNIAMPGGDAVELTRMLSSKFTRTSIIIMSPFVDYRYAAEALRAGAKGHIPFLSPPEEMAKAIVAISEGHRFLGGGLSERAIELYAGKRPYATEDRYHQLTPREKQIMNLLLGGSTNRDAAARLGISRRTVEIHRANLMRKLKIRSHAELASYAHAHGSFLPEPISERTK